MRKQAHGVILQLIELILHRAPTQKVMRRDRHLLVVACTTLPI